jgi:hypothetical protein
MTPTSAASFGEMADGSASGVRRQRFGLVVALAPAGKHLDRRRHDFGLPVARAAVVVPLAGLQAALDGDLLALAEVLAADLRQAVPDDHVVVFRALLAVAAELVCRHGERGDG